MFNAANLTLQIYAKAERVSCFIFFIETYLPLFSTEKRVFKKKLSEDQVKNVADQLANVKNTESFLPEMPPIQPKTEPEEQQSE